jgi:hypothetical protein
MNRTSSFVNLRLQPGGQIGLMTATPSNLRLPNNEPQNLEVRGREISDGTSRRTVSMASCPGSKGEQGEQGGEGARCLAHCSALLWHNTMQCGLLRNVIAAQLLEAGKFSAADETAEEAVVAATRPVARGSWLAPMTVPRGSISTKGAPHSTRSRRIRRAKEIRRRACLRPSNKKIGDRIRNWDCLSRARSSSGSRRSC